MQDTVTIAHLTDVHLGPIAGFVPRYWTLKRALGLANWLKGRQRAHQRGLLDRLSADLLAQRPDHIAVTGDLTRADRTASSASRASTECRARYGHLRRADSSPAESLSRVIVRMPSLRYVKHVRVERRPNAGRNIARWLAARSQPQLTRAHHEPPSRSDGEGLHHGMQRLRDGMRPLFRAYDRQEQLQ